MGTERLEPPRVVSEDAQHAFDIQAQSLGMDPADTWVGGYVAYEWEHLRHILDSYDIRPDGLKVLEFGCNVGASAVLFAHLGAQVTAIDIDAGLVELARLNAERHGIDNIDFLALADSRALPFEDRTFDLVTCNSVLEYVASDQLGGVQQEIDRVTRPGGRILVTGTSNRLWPKEVHSGRWLINYTPEAIDRLLGGTHERGITPWQVRYGFGPHYANLDAADGGRAFVRSRRLMGTSPALLKVLTGAAGLLRVGPGMLANNISCVLQKQP